MLSDTQKEILEMLKDRLLHGDIADLAKQTGKSRVYVGKVLNPNADYYNEEIVAAAVELVKNRKQGTENLLKELQVA